MKVIIDIPNDDYEFVKEQVDTEYCNDVRQINNRLYQIIANGTVFPDNATNGDIIQNICSMWIEYHNTDIEETINKKIWNASYTGGKNEIND